MAVSKMTWQRPDFSNALFLERRELTRALPSVSSELTVTCRLTASTSERAALALMALTPLVMELIRVCAAASQRRDVPCKIPYSTAEPLYVGVDGSHDRRHCCDIELDNR